MKKNFLVIVSILMIAMLGFQSVALAAQTKKPKKVEEIVYGDSIIKTTGNFDDAWVVPSPDADKNTYDPQPALNYVKELRQKKNKGTQDVTIMGSAQLYNRTPTNITPPGGSSGDIAASLDTGMSFGSNWILYSGHASTSWLGTNPWTANEILMTNRIHLESNIYQIGLGLGWTTIGDDMYREITEPNIWQIAYNFTGLRYDTTGTLQWTAEYITGSFKFVNLGVAYVYDVQTSDRYDF